LGTAFLFVFGEEGVVGMVEKLIGIVLHWSSDKLWRGCGGFGEER
jgi:hypothetical protein